MKAYVLIICCLAAGLLITCQKAVSPVQTTGTVKITIKNTVKGIPMVLNTGNYTNSFGEQYNISAFKYYLSHVSVTGAAIDPVYGKYYLVDEENPASLSFSFEAPVNIYSTVYFLLGVDSTRNVSGAQTYALDPLNDMFWTWNSGYIMAKMEGTSPQSTVVNNKVEYHIGGFSGTHSVLKNMTLTIPVPPLSKLDVRQGKVSELFLEADLDTWWQGAFNLKIADHPAVTHPGAMAKSISDNYVNMFTITHIINH